MLDALQDLIRFDRQVKSVAGIAPKAVKVHITEDMLPWLEIAIGCASAGKPDFQRIRMALWMAGLYQSPDTPDGKPEVPA